jgi:glycosyltransferase involved in cell wall biosynthesis
MNAAAVDARADEVRPHAQCHDGGARLRIVHAVCSQGFAGVERYVCSVARRLTDRGHDVVVVGGDPHRMAAGAGPSVVARPGRSVSQVARALLAERRCDIVHVHMTAAELALVAVTPMITAATVSTRHFAAHRGSSAAARIAVRGIPRVLDRQIAISQFVAERTEGSSVVLPNGVASWSVDALEAATATRERIVLVAQRLEAEKETAVAIEAFARSGLAREGWQLVIAGQGSQLDPTRASVASLGIGEAVELVGWVPDLQPWFRRASMLLAPAPAEPFGLTVAEAMAAGLPVVAARGGAHVETVGRAHPETLFEPGDASAAADVLRRLSLDPELRKVMGRMAGAVQREHFDLDRHVDGLLAIYRVLADARGAAGVSGRPHRFARRTVASGGDR